MTFTPGETGALQGIAWRLSQCAANATDEASAHDMGELAEVSARLLRMAANMDGGADVIATVAIARQLADAYAACVACVAENVDAVAVPDAALAARDAVRELLARARHEAHAATYHEGGSWPECATCGGCQSPACMALPAAGSPGCIGDPACGEASS